MGGGVGVLIVHWRELVGGGRHFPLTTADHLHLQRHHKLYCLGFIQRPKFMIGLQFCDSFGWHIEC